MVLTASIVGGDPAIASSFAVSEVSSHCPFSTFVFKMVFNKNANKNAA
ncbi:hypothetical protein KHA80_21920 [Anaerobacillus sp. HL2]|nr:hypothetical protein KHA80_21920 [Anaerobacillus sp. HL2]